MAKYLGKISAVVTANTAEFTSKLNSAAGTVRKFAGEVQGNITGAMNDADRALKSVLTPLQKLQASLKAASSIGLDFKGFDGAIRDIEGLKARMQTLKGASVKLVLDASGFKSIESYRNALDGLSKRGAKILVDVGGLEKAKAIQATLLASGDKTIKIGLAKINRGELDSVIAAVDKLGEKEIKAVLTVLGKADLDAAVQKTEQMFSASEQIAKPLGAAVAQFGNLSYAVQAGFMPALNMTQKATLKLFTGIDNGVKIGVGEFDRLDKQVVKTAQSIQRMVEVAGLVGKIKTGKELAFQEPKMMERLSRAASQGDQAAALPPDTLASNKTIAPLLAQASALALKISEVDAKIMGLGAVGLPNSLKQQLAVLSSALDSINNKVATELKIQLDATAANAAADALREKFGSLAATLSATTDPYERIAASANKARAAVDALANSAGKTALKGQLGLSQQTLQGMSAPGAVNTPESMAAVEKELERIAALAARGLKIQLDATEATATLEALNARITTLAATLSPTTDPYEKLAASARKAKNDVDALADSAQKTALQGDLGVQQQKLQRMSVPGSVNTPESMAAVEKELERIAAKAARGLKIQLDATAAMAEVNALNEKIASLYATLTGPTDPFGRMAASARGAKEAVDALGEGAEKTALQSRLGLSEQSLQRMSVPGTVNTPKSMAAVGTELEKIKALAASGLKIQLDATEATATLEALNARITTLAATLSPTTDPYEKLAASARKAKNDVDALADSAQKTALQGDLGVQQQKLQRMSVPGSVNTPQSMAAVEKELDKIAAKARQKLVIQLDVAAAQAAADTLKSKLASLAATLSAPTDPYEKLAASAVRAKAAVDALDDSAEKTALQGQLGLQQQQLQRMSAPGFIASANAMGSSERGFDRIANRAASERVVQVDTTAATASVAALRKDLSTLASTIGDPSDPIVRMTAAVNASVAAVAALNDGLEKTALQAQLGGLRATLEGAAAGSGPLPPDLITDAEREARAVTAGAGAAAEAQVRPLGDRSGGVGSGNDMKNQMALLQSSTIAAKAQLDQLPISMRSRFVPAIQAAEAEFHRLRAAAGRTAEEIENAGNEVARLKAAMSAAASIKMSGAVINDGAIARSMGRLNGMQEILLRVGATASGPVSAAYDRLARAQARALSSGSAGTPAATQSLRRYEEAAIRAAVATGEISRVEARRLLNRAGDRGRGGMDRFSMAANQAAFALDDFFSSVGGWDQKLRAVSNNVTQLGFVLGGTTGLFVGLGAVLVGQVAVGIYKWINAGRTAEDQTKALNEALSRQKSLVDDLAQSFKGLADAIGKGMFSEGGRIGIDFGKDVGDVKRKQKELRDSRRNDIDPEVQKERANQARDQRLLDKSENIGSRIALQRQIDESKAREKDAMNRASNAPRPSRDKVVSAIAAAREELLWTKRGIEPNLDFSPEGKTKRRAEVEATLDGNGSDVEQRAAQRKKLNEEIKVLSDRRAELNSGAFGDSSLDSSINSLETMIKDLEDPMHAAIDKLALEIVEASNDAAQRIAAAQKDVASAIERGVVGATAFQRELDANAAALASANDTLAQASKILNPEERQRAMDAAQGDVKRAEKNLEDTESKRRSVRLGMTQGGDRTKDALSSLQGDRELMNSRAVSVGRDRVDKENAAREKAGVSSGKLARAQKEQQDARSALSLAGQTRNLNPSAANNAAFEAANQAFLDAQKKLADALAASKVDDEAVKIAQAESEAAAAMMELTRALEDSVSRIRKIASDALSTSTQMADQAQRDFTEQKPVAQGGLPPWELTARRDQAEFDLINDKETIAKAQAGITAAREEAQLSDPRVNKTLNQLEAIEQDRKLDQAKMLELRGSQPGGELTREQEEQAGLREYFRRRNEAELQAERDQALAQNAGVQSAQATADKAAQEIDQRRQNQEAAAAGRELALTPREKQAEEMATGVNQLKQKGLETADNAERARIINNGAKNLRAQAAPMIEAMNNSRLSAILEGNNGPSRQALKVSDVNTMEGQSEMNRLLRGDDAAKNVDLEELRKQTQALNDLNKMVGEAKQALGVA